MPSKPEESILERQEREERQRRAKTFCWHLGTSQDRWVWLYSNPSALKLFMLLAQYMDGDNRFPVSRSAIAQLNGAPPPANFYRSMDKLKKGLYLLVAPATNKNLVPHYILDPRLVTKTLYANVRLSMTLDYLGRAGEDVAQDDFFHLNQLFRYTEVENPGLPLGGIREPMAEPHTLDIPPDEEEEGGHE